MNITKYLSIVLFMTSTIATFAMRRTKSNLILPSIYCAQRFYTQSTKKPHRLVQLQKDVLKKGSPIINANYGGQGIFHMTTKSNHHYYTKFPYKHYSVIKPKKRK